MFSRTGTIHLFAWRWIQGILKNKSIIIQLVNIEELDVKMHKWPSDKLLLACINFQAVEKSGLIYIGFFFFFFLIFIIPCLFDFPSFKLILPWISRNLIHPNKLTLNINLISQPSDPSSVLKSEYNLEKWFVKEHFYCCV